MKFLHAADLHLDSPLRGLERYEGAPVEQIRGATRRALENLVSLCLEERVELLLIAGDLYDDDWRDYATGLFFAAQMARLREAGSEVVWIRGNHDAASKLTRHLRLPENVHELPYKQPASVRFEQLGVSVHGQGFATREVTEDLSVRYPAPDRDAFNVGLLHTALDGRAGHAPYAPCRLAALIDRGYEYWALGHVHRREIVHSDPWVVFPGNLQGRHARETGAKGATLVSVEGSRVLGVEARTLDEVRWQVLEVPVAGCRHSDELLARVRSALASAVQGAEGRLLAARVRLLGASGRGRPFEMSPARLVEEVRAVGLDLGGAEVWIEKVELAAELPPERASFVGDDAIRRALAGTGDVLADGEAEASLREELAELVRKLPAELAEGADGLDFQSDAGLAALLTRARAALAARLEPEDEPP